MEELLGIFPSQIRRLSNKKMDEINHEIQQARTSAGNCCLPVCSSGKKEARGERRTALVEAVPWRTGFTHNHGGGSQSWAS